MSETNGNGGATASLPPETDKRPIVLHDTMEGFARAVTQEFTIGSAIDPALEAGIEIVCDTAIGAGGEVVHDPVADFLGWEPKTSQNGFSMKRTIFAALLRNEDGTPWQAKVNYQPWRDDKGKHGKPYIDPKKIGDNDPPLYMPPVPPVIRQKVADRYGVAVPMEGSFWDWAKESGVQILVTEGGKKTLAALSLGVLAVGVYGVNAGYRLDGEGGYRLIDDLSDFRLDEREVALAFDKDEAKDTQRKVASAEKKMAALLQQEGAIVKAVRWKAADGKGLDDVIKNKGAKFMQRALDRAKVMAAVEVPEAVPYEENPKGQESGSIIQWTPGMYLLANIGRILGKTLDSYITLFGQVHEWTGKFYDKQDDGTLLRKIQIAFSQYSYEIKGVTTFPFAKTKQGDEALRYLKNQTFTHPKEVAQSGLCLSNGILRINWKLLGDDDFEFLGFELVPHDKKYHFLYCSDVEYNPDASPDDCDRLLKAIPSEQRQTWLEHQSLIFDFKKTAVRFGRPRAGVHEGTGSNGKDACRQAISDIFPGMGAFTFGDFQQYENGRQFTIASLPKFRLSWSSENSSKLKVDNLKSLIAAISGDSIIKSEFKNKDALEYVPDCLFHFNVNKAPLTDATDFIRTRFAIYNYPYTYSSSGEVGTLEADKRFTYDSLWRVKNVSSALLNRLIEAFTTAWSRGGVDYSPCEDRLKEWAADRNHILQFGNTIGLKEGSATDSIEISDLWGRLEDWYLDNDLLSLDSHGGREWASDPSNFDPLVKKSADLFARLQAIFPKIKRSKAPGNRRTIVTGLKIVTPNEVKETPTVEAISAAPVQQELQVETIAPAPEPIVEPAVVEPKPEPKAVPVEQPKATHVHSLAPSRPATAEPKIEEVGEHPDFPNDSIVRYDLKFWRVKGFVDGKLQLKHNTQQRTATAFPGEVELQIPVERPDED